VKFVRLMYGAAMAALKQAVAAIDGAKRRG
jgi:hypothetical protein